MRTMLDILDDTVAKNKSGMFMTIDFEKAFDSLNWKFLEKAMNIFNFGKSIVKSVKIFYNDVSSCIINKNVTSRFF